MVDLNRLEGVVAQGITAALGEALPHVDSSSRYTAAQHVANTLFRLIRAGSFNEALEQAKKEPLVEAPVMDLKSSLKTKLICEWVH
jgi:hypothetical protein